MKFNEWLRIWLDEYVLPFAKRRTYLRYSEIVRDHIAPAIGETEIDGLTPIMLQRLVNELMISGNKRNGGALASSSVNGVINVIKGSLKCAQRVGIANKCASDGIVRPKTRERRIECFTLEEQREIEHFVEESGRLCDFGIILCLYTGVRIGELLALEWSDIDLKGCSISISKSCHYEKNEEGVFARVTELTKTPSSERVIPISSKIALRLCVIKKSSHSKYVISNGKMSVGVRSYQKRFSEILRKLEIRHRGFHSLRHTFATRAIECGMDLKCLSEILGHSSSTVTLNRYVHTLPERKRAMMECLGELL